MNPKSDTTSFVSTPVFSKMDANVQVWTQGVQTPRTIHQIFGRQVLS